MSVRVPPKLEIAGIQNGRDITRPFIGPLLYPLDTVLGQKNHDYTVYESLLRDSQVFSCLQQRFKKTIGCEWLVDAASDSATDQKAAEFIRELLNKIPWDAITERMLYATFFGFSIAELQWAYDGQYDTIQRIDVRAQRRFRFHTDMKPKLITPESWEGEDLPDRKFWWMTFGGHRSDEPYGLGLAHQLYWLVYFKRNGLKSWLKFLDRFGHPLPLVKYGENASQQQKEQALDVAMAMAEDSAAAAPEGLLFELIESSRNGTADYTTLIELLDKGISKVILSQTMTTDDGSSQSQATVHDKVSASIIKSDADLVCESFNQGPIKWLTELNFPDAAPPRVWRKTQPDVDLKSIVDRDKVLFDMGYPPSPEYIVEIFGEGFRPPEKGEDAIVPLNGAQVQALTSVISQAIQDDWIPELAVATIRASFPSIATDVMTAIAEQLQTQADKRAELAKPQEAILPPDQAAAQFADTEAEPIDEARFVLLQNLDRAVDAMVLKSSEIASKQSIDFAIVDRAEKLLTADYAGKKGSKGGKKDCKQGKLCKSTCIAKTKTCLSDMNPQQLAAHKAAQKAAKKSKGGGGGAVAVATNTAAPVVTPAPIAPPVPPVPAVDVKLNQTELDAKRAQLEKQFGQKLVEDAEANTKKLLQDKDTNVFVRVGSTETLGFILGDRFKTSAELGITTHSIPDLKDKNYQDARNRVEAKSLGYGLNTKPEDRPIYGYLGGKDLNGNAHLDVSQAYGSIAVKLKSEVKDRTSFTGADTFKSGIGSKLSDPNAASIASVTKFGHDPNHPDVKGLASTQMGTAAQKKQLELAAKAKSIDELNGMAPTGNKYIEAQVHGKVGPKDIAEIHFQPKDRNDRPTPEIAKLAKDNGIDLYVNGKKVDPDDIINAKDPRSQRLRDLDSELNTAMKTGDFGKVAALTEAIGADAKKTKLAPGENDPILKTLSAEAGYSEKPTVLSKKDMDAAAKDGATLMNRGLSDYGLLKSKTQADQFRSGDFFTGKGIYGNGTYVGHSGTFVQGKPGNSIVSKGRSSSFDSDRFIPGNNAADAKAAWKGVAVHGYIKPTTTNMRMALPRDANVVTHTTMGKEIKAVREGISSWAAAEKLKLQNSLGPAVSKAIAKGEKDFKASIDTKSAGFVPASLALKNLPGLANSVQIGEIRIPKKDGSGVVSYPVAFDRMGGYHLLDGNGMIASGKLTIAAAKKQAIANLTSEAGRKAAGGGVSIADVKFTAGTFRTKAKIPGLKDDLIIRESSSGNFYYFDPKTDMAIYGKTAFRSKEDAVQHYLDSSGIAGKSLVDPAKIKAIDKKADQMRDFLLGDAGDAGNGGGSSDIPQSSGRLAVIRGYDAVALNGSYQADAFMLLLNRSKVMVQDKDISFATGQKSGVL